MRKNKENWQAISELQIKVLKIFGNNKRGFVNYLTLKDFLSGKNPNYQVFAGKVKAGQIEKAVELGKIPGSYVNVETLERFLRKQKPFTENYVNLKEFAKTQENLCIWDSVFYHLKDDPEVENLFMLSDVFPKFYAQIPRDMTLTDLVKFLGSGKVLSQQTSKVSNVLSLIMSDKFIPNDERHFSCDYFFPVSKKYGGVIFLKAWKYNKVINLEAVDAPEFDFIFEKGSRIYI